MNALYSLVFVFILVLVPLFGVGAAHLDTVFGICIPMTAISIFLVFSVVKIVKWGRSPVPFRIPTTAGQQRSFDPELFKQSKWDNPSTGLQTVIRMVLEICTFRTLFRNTSTSLHETKQGPVVAYASSKWLWLFALLFHYSFLTIVLRHMRLFLEPIPFFVNGLEFLDGILQIGAPVLYQSDALIVVGVLFLLVRRLADPKIRYISLVADYFPLFLILGIALSGIWMRYYAKVDIISIKELTMGLVTLNPHIPAGVDVSFYVHVFLVSVLLMYFPFSKLMHMPGVFLSPTRNMPNDNRFHHHENPWNPAIKPLSYEAYEKDFGPFMAEAGLPLDNPDNGKAAEEA